MHLCLRQISAPKVEKMKMQLIIYSTSLL